ncbi:MAG: alpha/beta hydrolase [Chloroflexota bacterium]|nr:alpha/beta hydrolase [Chloroflexota bacterium]
MSEQSNGRYYTEELLYVEREDGLLLEGALVLPASAVQATTAVVWVHGNTSRFYDDVYLFIGREVARRGYPFMTVNTHGHDVIAPIWGPKGEATPGGASWERFSEVPLDMNAWIGYAVARGFQRVVLAGHSFGANKVVYHAAQHHGDERIVGVIAASPDIKWSAPPERLRVAEAMEAGGRMDSYMPHLDEDPAWYGMSVRTFLERARIAQHVFGSDTQTPYISNVRVPVLAFYGTEETWLGGRADLEQLKQRAHLAPRFDVGMIEGADHAYWGKHVEAAELIAGWIGSLKPQSEAAGEGDIRRSLVQSD